MADESNAQSLALIEAARLGDLQQVYLQCTACRRLPGSKVELGIAFAGATASRGWR